MLTSPSNYNTPEEAFEHWKITTVGRPCDYSGLSYEKLSKGSGIQWPCNEKYPNGKERLFGDGIFPTKSEECESYGHDLETGATLTAEAYKAMNPNGRAILKACNYKPAREMVNDEYPFSLMTGRNVFHFHTRSKTGRSKILKKAAPDANARISTEDAKILDIEDGDMIVVSSRRGKIQVPAAIGNIDKGKVFVPMHWGYFDKDDDRSKAGNELTVGECYVFQTCRPEKLFILCRSMGFRIEATYVQVRRCKYYESHTLA